MAPVETTPVKPTPTRVPNAAMPRILIVDDEPHLIELIGDLIRQSVRCQVLSAHTLDEARRVMAAQNIHLLVADVHLPDGDGMSLLPLLRERQPCSTAIIMTGAPSLDGAISALREGALDFVPKPFTNDQLIDRVKKALEQQSRLERNEQRFERLRDAVKRLNAARRMISRKVDLLCNDLVTAYGELSRQLDGVRTQEGFRKYIEEAVDLEQLLCHAMDWLLRQMGYCNVAVWLAADEGEFQLGAYMKYTVPGEPILIDALKRVLLPLAAKDGVTHVRANDLETRLTPQEMHYLRHHDVLAVNCTYLGEPLAAMVFFRDAKAVFTADDEALVKAISPIFAVALTKAVRQESGESPFYDGEPDTGHSENLPAHDDSSDWWKHGGEAPF